MQEASSDEINPQIGLRVNRDMNAESKLISSKHPLSLQNDIF